MSLYPSSDDDDSSTRDTDSAPHPFTWILVPLAVLVAAAIGFTFFRYKRRNEQRASYGMNALARDLEAMPPNRVRRPSNVRWNWAGTDPQISTRRMGFGVTSREEGLNEFGEAPPAYTPPRKTSDDVEPNETHETLHSPVASAPSTQPGVETAHIPGTNMSNLPAYEDATQSSDSAGQQRDRSPSARLGIGIHPPPTAHLSPR